MTKTKKIKHSGRFGVRYGIVTKARINKIEAKQRKKQKCPFCKAFKLKREAAGIWFCNKCKRRFASSAYFLEE